MIVEITNDILPYDVVISCDKPGMINAAPNVPITVVVDVKKDGIDGLNAIIYPDLELPVENDGQTIFNIYNPVSTSSLYVNDSVFFVEKSYHIAFINNAWKLIWLNEFPLTITDYLIFKKIN